MPDQKTFRQAIDTVRLLAGDAVQEANSGHPGMPMGCADFAFTLWYKYLRHNPQEPQWLGRDRFVLSAGHGSMLIYSLLHLFGYDLPMSELKNFRQWNSKTPGHPEFGHTPGVEVTTGPLGTGFASAVGMAIAAKQLAARLGNEALFNQRIFALSGDGCMMEGVTSEAASLAGHNKLDNLVVFYDSNSITIEGSTDLAFSEDVGKRFEAYGWRVIKIDGQDLAEIDRALDEAVNHKGSPVLIIGTTTIGFGAPNKAGSHDVHGAPLGEDELAAAKAALGFCPDESFVVGDSVRALCDARGAELADAATKWDADLEAFLSTSEEARALLTQLLDKPIPANLTDELLAVMPTKNAATRKSGGAILQRAAALIPSIAGGAADLNPSTNTHLAAESDFCPVDFGGRNVHFGVREFAMGLCANGMALYGTTIPFTATFAVFSDFMKPALRLAALQQVHAVFIFTHDSVFVGEDGPTHQPIDQLAMLRAIPGLTVLRPAESHEVAHAWATALSGNGPVALFLTRQTVANFSEALAANVDVAKGGYVLTDDEDFEAVVMATGSEVPVALEAVTALREKGRRLRLVSLPSWELFELQSQAYRDSVLPPDCDKRVTIEAASTLGWHRYAGINGLTIGIDHFGHSAPAEIIQEQYGLTAAALADRIDAYVAAK